MLSTAVLLAASMVVGQAEGQPKQNEFGKLRAFLGTWEATDIEFLGQKIRVTGSWRFILDGRFIENDWMILDANGKPTETGLMILGPDPSDKRTKFWAFLSDGGCAQGTMAESDGKKFVLTTQEVRAGDTKRNGQISLDLAEKNSYRWEISYEDGKKGHGTFRRAKLKKDFWPQPTTKMPEGISEQLKDIAWWTGGFTTEGSDAFTGKTSVGQSRCGWTLDGKFLLYDLAYVESDLTVGRYRAIIGVDPSTNKTTGWEFDSTGTVGKYTVSDKGQDIVGKATSPTAGPLDFKGRLTQTANGIEYRATGKLPKGKETNYYGIWKKPSAQK